MTGFKESIEKSVEKTVEKSVVAIGKEINDRIDTKMNHIDEGIKNLKTQMDENEVKQDNLNKQLEMRLKRIEEDRRRESYGRMKSNSLRQDQPLGRRPPNDHLSTKTTTTEMTKITNHKDKPTYMNTEPAHLTL